MSVCNVIVGFNSNDGFLIILLLATNALQMEKYLYTIVLIQWSNQPYDMQFFWQFLWCIMLSMKLISIVEPFHRTHAQMFRTHVLINYLKCQRWDDQAISNELETFVRLLMLRNPTYSPLNMITLERSFLIQLSGCILTYLVIMLTYGLEVLI
ncbi:uncharacterized protein LOC120627593 [Pararge aegeria]|uniref:uncharacterized protein LOC120627593 n=1 Tax=Pararge aegeria TaxID=116150 RepID=UPI0019CF4E4F|nr:uncharacterized protein LOC120627593 [Pararge aegeria]